MKNLVILLAALIGLLSACTDYVRPDQTSSENDYYGGGGDGHGHMHESGMGGMSGHGGSRH